MARSPRNGRAPDLFYARRTLGKPWGDVGPLPGQGFSKPRRFQWSMKHRWTKRDRAELEDELNDLRRAYHLVQQDLRTLDAVEPRAHVLGPAGPAEVLDIRREALRTLAAYRRQIAGLGKALGYPLEEIDDWLD